MITASGVSEQTAASRDKTPSKEDKPSSEEGSSVRRRFARRRSARRRLSQRRVGSSRTGDRAAVSGWQANSAVMSPGQWGQSISAETVGAAHPASHRAAADAADATARSAPSY